MKPDQTKEETLFNAARALTDPKQRAAFLDAACQGDGELRRGVEVLLAAQARAGVFFDRGPQDLGLGLPTTEAASSARVDSPASEKTGDRIGRYKLLQKIGEGGCGIVYMAEQQEPMKRRVALKVIKLGMDTRQVIARFEVERQALALMDHPNIAKVLDAGATETGRPYFVMELVRGISMTEYCDQNHLTTRKRLELFVQICRAIQHAHQKGVIHRDIKPSNVLVTVHDGVPTPKVIDFGVAKATAGRLTDQTLVTEFRQFVGTPAYMSPEQAEMSGLDIDTRSDVYSLGVLLYELLTGRTPFESKKLIQAGIDEIRRIIREDEPPRPSTRLTSLQNQDLFTTAKRRQVDPGKLLSLIRGDLDSIVMKALEKDRTRRYETVNGLATDVYHHLQNEPILARPAGLLEQAVKWARRRPAAAALTGVIAAGLVACAAALAIPAFSQVTKSVVVASSLVCAALAIYAYKQALVATRSANEAAHARQRADENRQKAEENRQRAEENARAEERERRRAEEAYSRVAETLDQMDLGIADTLFRAGERLGINPGASDIMTALAYLGRVLRRSPGNRVAAARLMDTFCRHSLPLHIRTIQLDAPMRCIAFSRDGQRLATVSADGVARIWNICTGEASAPPMPHDNEVLFTTFAKDADRLVSLVAESSTKDAEPVVGFGQPRKPSGVQVWDAQSGHQICAITPPSGIADLSFTGFGRNQDSKNLVISPDGRRIFLTAGSRQLEAWNADTGNIIGDFRPCKRARPVAVSGDGKLLLAKGPDVHEGKPGGMQFLLLRPRFFVLDAATGALRYRLVQRAPRRSCFLQPHFSADSRYLFDFAYSEDSVGVLAAETGVPLAEFLRPISNASEDDPFALRHLQVSESHMTINANYKRVVEPLRIVSTDLHRWNIWPCLSPDGSKLATPCKENVIQIWDVRSGLPHYEDFLPAARLSQTDTATLSAFNYDGLFVAYAFSDHRVRVFDTASGRLLTDSVAHEDTICALHFSADGRRLATASKDKTARVWDAKTGMAISTPLRHETELTAALIDPGGNRLMTVTQSGKVFLWDVNSGRLTGQPLQHPGDVLNVQWSPDSEKVLTVCADGRVRIWDVETGRLLTEAIVHSDKVVGARFSPNGKCFATASSDRTARIWDVANGTPITPAMSHDAPVFFVDFSPDGLKVVTVAADRTARIWDARSGEPTTSPLKHKPEFSREGIHAAHFLENGLWISTGGAASRVWDVRTGQALTGESSTEPWFTYSGCCVVDGPNGPTFIPLRPRQGTPFMPVVLAPLPIPAWLPCWAEAASGLRIGHMGEVEQISFDELSRLRKEIMERPDSSVYGQWAKWYFADRESRHLNPYSQVTVRQFVAQNIKAMTDPIALPFSVTELSLTDASEWAKSARSHLARLHERGTHSDKTSIQRCLGDALFDSERSLRLSASESEAWQARAEFWRELGNLAEAFDAAHKADQLHPDNPEIWSLRASLLELSNSYDDALQSYSQAIVLAEAGGPVGTAVLAEALLRRSRLLKRLSRSRESQADFLRAKNIPARAPEAGPELIDLSSDHNASLTESWLAPYYDAQEAGMLCARATPSDLAELPRGFATFRDVLFDVRGLIQVGAASPSGENYPTEVTDIQVRRACARMHFLHAAIFAADAPDGTRIGSYIIRYETGRQVEIPILIGESLADCFTRPNEENKPFTIAWTGRNAESRWRGTTVRLFKSTWQNPAPTETIRSIDFVFSPPGPAAPFLVAITAATATAK